MGLFYKASAKKLVEVRNEIFVKNGISELKRNYFEIMPYNGKWFGKNNLGDYTYELCRLNTHSHLEIVTTEISKGDVWIKVYLNIFDLKPKVKSLNQLSGLNVIKFYLPPNSVTAMRLRIDDFKGMPLFNTVEYKIKSYYSERGFQERVRELGDLIASDLNNIDYFVKRWYELHTPMVTDREGKMIDEKK